MPANLKVAIDRLYELRDQLDRGASLPEDETTAALVFLQFTLEDVGQSQADGLLGAMALLCSRQASLFHPLARQSLLPLVRNGLRHSHEVAAFAQSALRNPRSCIELDERARGWLAREFVAMAVPVQYILDELVAKRGPDGPSE